MPVYPGAPHHPLYSRVFRFDDDMFVTPHLHGVHGAQAPILKLRRSGSSGVFDRFVAHFDAVWNSALPWEA